MQLPLETVLVTTDLSPLSDTALPVAFRFARDHGAGLLVLSVVELPPPPNPLYAHYYPTPDQASIAKSLADVRKELERRVESDMTHGVSWSPMIAEGDAATEIARVVAETKTSLLVMATHGRTGMKRYLLGSVAERVLKTTACPVLLIR